jgi:5-formyltetrahydrofolate cyclo-ligase
VGPDEQRSTQDKAQLRAALLAARRTRSPEDLTRARAAVVEQVIGQLDGVGLVAGYEPMRTEPGSVELLVALHDCGISVLVPVTLPDRDLDWVQWTPAGTGPRLGPDAITRAELVLAPALAVARDGTRLGRGGGSYDRALARCPADAVLAAVVFDEEVVDVLPSDAWDVPVRLAVTPSGWRTLGNTGMQIRR